MGRFNFFAFNGTIETDKLNRNFENVRIDINEILENLAELDRLTSLQARNITYINQYRSSLLSTLQTMESNNTIFTDNDLDIMYMDVNTCTSTYNGVHPTYGHVILDSISSFNRFPITINEYGTPVPLYDAVKVYRDGALVGNDDPLLLALVDDPRQVYIEKTTGLTPVEYTFISNVNVPIINSIEIHPVFGGLTSLSGLQYGVGNSNWTNVGGGGTYTSFYGREFVFKQLSNAAGFKFTMTPSSLGSDNAIGFYKVGAAYKQFIDTGTVLLEQGKPTDYTTTDGHIDYIYLDYDLFTHTVLPNVIRNIMRIQIYESATSGLTVDQLAGSATELYDTDEAAAYPLTSAISMSAAADYLYTLVTLRKYDGISPIFKHLKLGLSTAT